MRKQSRVAKIRSKAIDLLVLLIFLLPAFMSIMWIHSVFASADHREVFSSEQLSAFHDNRYPVDSGSVKPFDEPLITITFDDGWESTYSEGLPLLEKYGIASTHYILGDNFGNPEYLSLAQAHALQDAGHEIAAHTMTHPDLTKLSHDKLDWELSESDRLLTKEFGNIQDFATPLGASNDSVVAQTKFYYRSLRNTASDPAVLNGDDINTRDKFNPYNINAYTVRSTTKPEDIQRLIDYTIQTKGWLVLTYHDVGDSESSFWAVKPQDIDNQLRQVRDSRVRTATMGKVLDTLYPKVGK